MNLSKSESGAVNLDGCEGKFLQIVLEALQIKYEIVVSKDMLYGDPLPDGNFTGMVDMVQRGEVDLAMTCLAVNEIHIRSRILLTAWLLFVLLISLSYSVTLLSHLIQLAKVAPIRTFCEFSRAVQSGDHKAYVVENYIPFLLDSEEDHLKELREIIIHNNWITKAQKFVTSQSSRIEARVISGLLFGNRDDIFISDDEHCVLHIAFAYNNNFCCKSKLNAILSKLWGSGMFIKLLQDTSFKSFVKSRNNSYCSNIKSPLYAGDFMGVFTLLGIGLMLSFIVFILEINFPGKYFKSFREVNIDS
ncbi:glutamate receptor ionotropic, delta-1 [Caerostris extrusa]|uniref:Glutamate receptor ionotropic, delta-1 n=1 Tax=Caerostris extrusa TaxID=172846 RepID=A0AAV4Q536_CAEEX|nr:glutamate receptor ionotropic, delta-1 [Caerostris extrusa]